MATFIIEYRVKGYGWQHALSLDMKAGRRTFFVDSEAIGTEDIDQVFKAACDSINTPEGYEIFLVSNRDTGEKRGAGDE